MNCNLVDRTWNVKCLESIEERSVFEQIKELVYFRDRGSYNTGGLSKEECKVF